MIRQFQLIPVIVLLLLLQACTGTTTSSSESEKEALVLDVDFENKPDAEPLKLSEIIDSVTFIPIDTSQGIIGGVRDLKFVNGLYYLCDYTTSRIFIVNENGRVVNKIDKKGKARDEYLSLQNFDVNSSNNELSIYDVSSRQIKVYDKEGRFLRNVHLKDVVRDFAVLKNGDYLLYTPDYMNGRNRRGVWKTDSMGVFKKQLVTVADDFRYNLLSPNYFRRISNDTIGLMGEVDHNLIYHFTVDTMLVKYKINVDLKIPKDLWQNPLLAVGKYKDCNNIPSIKAYVETNHLLYFYVMRLGEESCAYFYDKQLNKSWRLFKEEDFIVDRPIYGHFQFCYEDRLISVLPTTLILNSKKLKKRFPFITLNSNPVLSISYVKKEL